MTEQRRSPVVQLVLGRLRAFFREPSTLFWSIAFPLVLSIGLGIAFRVRPPDPVYVAVEQGADSAHTREVIAKEPGFNVKELDANAAFQALRTGSVSIVVIPGVAPTYRFDPTRPESRLARVAVDDVLQRAAGRVDTISSRDEKVTAPGARYIDFLLPGLIGMNIMSGGLWSVGYVIADLRARKLLKRLLATPMSRSQFLLSFLLSRAVFLALELPAMLIMGSTLFGVPVHGSILLLCVLGLIGSMTFSGIGVLCASRAENTQTVAGLVNAVSMPMFIFSGVFFPAARFPASVQPFLRALPLTAFNDAVRAVMIDGASLGAVLVPTLVLAAWGIVSFGLALKWFRWR